MMPMQQLQPQQVGPQGPVGPGGYPQMGPNPGGPQWWRRKRRASSQQPWAESLWAGNPERRSIIN